MPVHTEIRNGKIVVVDTDGRSYGTFASKPEAEKQVKAVNEALRGKAPGRPAK